jgi:hypothetical protein
MNTLEKNNTSCLCILFFANASNYTPSCTHVSSCMIWRVHLLSMVPWLNQKRNFFWKLKGSKNYYHAPSYPSIYIRCGHLCIHDNILIDQLEQQVSATMASSKSLLKMINDNMWHYVQNNIVVAIYSSSVRRMQECYKKSTKFSQSQWLIMVPQNEAV